jgi:diketogulonate reductase-like aldo/keto reductase
MLLDYINNGLIKGFGTYEIKDPVIIDNAIKNGYNFFDCAELYRNEKIIVDAVKNNPDKQLFISTKISYIAIEKQKIEQSFYKRLEMFNGLKINLLLLHKPSDNCKRDWDLLCELWSKHRDRIDYIGVSNYDLKHLEQIKDCPIQPFCNQVELSPFFHRTQLVEYCKNNNIIVIGHTTLTRCLKFDNPTLVYMANKYNTKVPKILLKWAKQNGYITIPRTSRLDHLLENLNDLNIHISQEDMNILNHDLNENYFLTKVLF